MASPSCDFGDSVRILKIPCQALGRSAVFRLGNQFDIVTARDLATLETATVIRTANRTISNWKALAVELEKDFGMLGSLKGLDGREGRLWHSLTIGRCRSCLKDLPKVQDTRARNCKIIASVQLTLSGKLNANLNASFTVLSSHAHYPQAWNWTFVCTDPS